MTSSSNAARGNQSSRDEDTILFGPHVVTLIDFLGQGEATEKWDFVPRDKPNQDSWEMAVKKSMGLILAWREKFDNAFKRFFRTMDDTCERLAAGKPREAVQQFNEFRKGAISTSHFSDTLIFSSPLRNPFGYCHLLDIAAMVATCGTLMLEALATKTPVRGAIDVGMIGKLPTGEPYGPAVSKAHRLESKLADYPRILVGADLIAYLGEWESDCDTTGPTLANRSTARTCSGLIAKDADGQHIVDYLNDQFAGYGDRTTRDLLRSKAYAFVRAEHDRFKKENNRKLWPRYEALLGYFHSRGVTGDAG